MRVKLDENLDVRLVDPLVPEGHDAITIARQGLSVVALRTDTHRERLWIGELGRLRVHEGGGASRDNNV